MDREAVTAATTDSRFLENVKATHAVGAVGLAAALSLVPVAIYAGSVWWATSLTVAMGCIVYLARPAR